MSYTQAAEALRPNPEQWEAYTSTGDCVVLAGPGSGKTKVLTLKMARVLSEDVRPPHGVACVTYNNECVRELRKRLDGLQVEESRRVFVGTLHAFCLRHVLVPFAHLTETGLPPQLRVAGEKQILAAMHQALVALNQHTTARQARHDVNVLRCNALDRTPEQGWQPGDLLTDLALEYESTLKAEGYVDFDMIISTAMHLIETHEFIRTCLHAKFPILFVDEYQDLGAALDRIVYALCFHSDIRLFAVGDPDQSIYGFIGARPELLEKLAKMVQPVRLRLNYRSGRKIILASETALGEERDYESKRDEDGRVDFYLAGYSVDEQVKHVVSKLLPSLVNRYSPGEIAVLYPSAWEGDLLERALGDSELEYVRLGRNAAYPKTPLTRFLEECAEWTANTEPDTTVLLSRLVKRWSLLLGQSDERGMRLLLARFLFQHRGDCQMSAHLWLSSFEELVVVGGGLQQALIDEGCADDLEAILDATAEGGPLEDFTLANLGGQVGSPDHLNLLTLHSSKGCEFDVVVIVGADEGRLPSFRVINSGSGLSEARRLFYVGVSRARHEVHIMSSNRNGSDRYQQGPSRFVADLQQALEAN